MTISTSEFDDNIDFTAGQLFLTIIRRDRNDVAALLDQVLLGFFDLGFIGGVRVIAQHQQRDAQYGALVFQPGYWTSVVPHLIPGSDVRTDLVTVVTNADGAPLVRNAVDIAGVIGRISQAGLQIGKVRDLAQIEVGILLRSRGSIKPSAIMIWMLWSGGTTRS